MNCCSSFLMLFVLVEADNEAIMRSAVTVVVYSSLSQPMRPLCKSLFWCLFI